MDTRIQELLDRADISDVVIRYASGVDRRDWALYRSCFAEQVDVDFSSFNGSPPSTLPADHWVERVRAGLEGFDATQHISTNHTISFPGGDRAEATCWSYVWAMHWLDGEGYVIGGWYDNRLVRTDGGWRIRSCTGHALWTQGDRRVFQRAAARRAGPA